MVYAVIAAGGAGKRLMSGIPKQFIEVGGKPIIVHSIEKFINIPKIDQVLVLCPEEWVNHTERLLAKYFPKRQSKVTVLKGGATRSETLMNAIDYIGEPEGDTVFVTHDAVRPFVTEEIIRENIEKMQFFDACTTAFPATDTLLVSRDGKTVDEVPERSAFYQVQTPQTFKALKFKEIYESMTEEEKASLTDVSRAFSMKGLSVAIVKGSASNMKITYPEDIKIAEAILGNERGKK